MRLLLASLNGALTRLPRMTGLGGLRRTIGSDINLGWLNTTRKNGLMDVSRRVSSRDARFIRLALTRTVQVEDIDFY